FSFICFPPLRSSLSYLVKELPSGSLPTFVEDDVVNDTRDIGLILIHSVTEWHSLFPQSYTYIPFGIPCGLLTLCGRYIGLPSSMLMPNQWVRFCLSAGGSDVRAFPKFTEMSNRFTFWFKPISVVWLVRLNDL
ncbi:hypothetical protein, partial [Bacteroides fragilis]|uniref:hypothetical protein n=3 Tax=Bacteroides fragilis TaxID=817 RepID=UPI001E472DAB